MNPPRKSMYAAAVRILSRMMDRPRAARPRQFRPLAEPMEVRAVLSHVAFSQAILAHGMAAPPSPRPMDTVEVNGQVEIQPDAVVRTGLSPR